MRQYLTPLIQLQRFFIPVLVVLLLWAIWRTLARRDYAIGLALYISLVVVVDGFLNTGIYLPGLSAGSVRYSEVWALILFAVRPKEPARQSLHTVVVFFVGAYFLLLLLSVFRSSIFIGAAFEFRTNIIPQIVAFALAIRGLGSSEDTKRFSLALCALLVFIGLFTFWDVFFDRWILTSDMLDKPIYSHNRQLHRFGSMFLNPNYLGAFIALVFPAIFVWTINERRRLARALAWTAMILTAFALVQTQSRGPLLAFGIVLVCLVFGPCPGISRRRRIGLLALCSMTFLIFMPGFLEHAAQRFNRINDETTEGRSRETTWQYTIDMIEDHPIGGIGFGEDEFSRTMVAYGFEERFGVEALDAPHNSYLQAAVYAGIPAVALFLLANLTVLLRAASVSFGFRENRDVATVFGVAVGIVGFLVSIFPDLQLFTSNVAAPFWLLFGLLLSQLTAVPESGHPASGSSESPNDAPWKTARAGRGAINIGSGARSTAVRSGSR